MLDSIRGLDFGTSTSLVSVAGAFGPVVVPLGRTDPWLPSVAGVQGDQWFVCERASSLPEDQLIRSVKRAITEKQDVVHVSDGISRIEADADEVILSILKSIAQTAGDEFAALTTRGSVRLGCPAMWDGEQRSRLVKLANEAGIPVGDSTLVDEPIAAGVAWIIERQREGHTTDGKVLVFDMGGGTLDVAVLSVEAKPGRKPSIAVQSAVGDNQAGDTLDEAIAQGLKQKFVELGYDTDNSPYALEINGWILRAAQQAKVDLGTAHSVSVNVPFPKVNLPVVAYTREELEEAFRPQLDQAMVVVKSALRSALMSQIAGRGTKRSMDPQRARSLDGQELYDGIDYVLLAGGMTKVPAVFDKMAQHFSPDEIYTGVEGDPNVAVVLGLGANEAYERLNLHRPGFSFVLEWSDGETGEKFSELIYEAYTPLYTFESTFNITTSPRFRWVSNKGQLPNRGKGKVRTQSMAGQFISLREAGVDQDWIDFNFGLGEAVITLEPSGRVFIRDGAGYTHEKRVSQWPVIRGTGHETIEIEDIKTAPGPRNPHLTYGHQESD